MSEVAGTIETTNVPNTGGPQIPGVGAVAKAPPNMRGVPDSAPAAAQESAKPEQTFDIAALAKALQEQQKSEAKEAPKELAQTGNPAIDAGIAMLKSVSKLTDADMVRAIGKAAEYGDENLIDTAFIKERFGEHAAYAELLAKAYLSDQTGQAQRAVADAYSIAGGKEQWDATAQVFNAKAPEHLRNAARALADSGDVKGAAQLVVETARAMGLVANATPKLQGGGAVNDALDAAGFSKAYAELRKSAGNRSLESPQFKQQYNALLARRSAGKAKGL